MTEIENKAPALCGHINKHYSENGKLVDLPCDLPEGHSGDHSALYHKVDYKDGNRIDQGIQRTYWSDMAGTPAAEIKPDDTGLVMAGLAKALDVSESELQSDLAKLLQGE